MENENRRVEDAERLPAEKLVWPREVTPTGPTTGWCGTCGSGNDAAGFAHLPLCPAAPAVDAAKLDEDEQTSLLVKIEDYMNVVDFEGTQSAPKCNEAEAEIFAHVDSLIAKRVPVLDAAELGKLKALAEAATPGEWTARVDETVTLRDSADNQLAMYTHLNTRTGGRRNSDEVAANARLAASANPVAILRIAALVAQQAARIEELERARQLDREGMKAALVDLHQRMGKSYAAEPTRRITFMDMEAAHEHVARLGFGGSLDAAMKEGK